MKSKIFLISLWIGGWIGNVWACGPFPSFPANDIYLFRSCTPTLEQDWQFGLRFQEEEREQNCRLWQQATSRSIPLTDIEYIVYHITKEKLSRIGEGILSDSLLQHNKFAIWLSKPQHRADYDCLMLAKEVERVRKSMADPWYYPVEDDEEHQVLKRINEAVQTQSNNRHAARYALQAIRILFTLQDWQGCTEFWEQHAAQQPDNILRKMIASYVGGAWLKLGDTKKAIALYTEAEDVGSLLSIKAWWDKPLTQNRDARYERMNYVFRHFPNSPLFKVEFQRHIQNMEQQIQHKSWGEQMSKEDWGFYAKLRDFAVMAATDKRVAEPSFWNYAASYLYLLFDDEERASEYLALAEQRQGSEFIKESIRAYRFYLDARLRPIDADYDRNLFAQLKWTEIQMKSDLQFCKLDEFWTWKLNQNYEIEYWFDVIRKTLLGEAYPRLKQAGRTTRALQLANYCSNRFLYEPLVLGKDSYYDVDTVSIQKVRTQNILSRLDFCNNFFNSMDSLPAHQAATYVASIQTRNSAFDRFLNSYSYTDLDYLNEHVGTLYLREMNYSKAVEYLNKVAPSYQYTTNLYGEYMRLDPFLPQDTNKLITDDTDYKLRFAREMQALEYEMTHSRDVNRRAMAKIRFAIGLRNSFGRCWSLTQYGLDSNYAKFNEDGSWVYSSSHWRETFQDNPWAQRAYRRVDALMDEALASFTDKEMAARVHLMLKNYKTVVEQYADTQTAEYVRGHCDRYNDYKLQKR